MITTLVAGDTLTIADVKLTVLSVESGLAEVRIVSPADAVVEIGVDEEEAEASVVLFDSAGRPSAN